MKHAHRSNWTRHHAGRPPPVASDRWGQNGLAAGRAPWTFGGGQTAPPPCYRSLLVPVDGDPFGEHALPLALGIARRAGAEVQVVHVRGGRAPEAATGGGPG